MAESVFTLCLDECRARITALQLDNLRDYEIIVRWLGWDQYQFHRGITIHPAKQSILHARGTNYHDDIGYGCQVTMVEANQSDPTVGMGRQMDWNEKIRKEFINQRMIGLPCIYTCGIEEQQIPIPQVFEQKNYVVHALVVRCWSRQTRG